MRHIIDLVNESRYAPEICTVDCGSLQRRRREPHLCFPPRIMSGLLGARLCRELGVKPEFRCSATGHLCWPPEDDRQKRLVDDPMMVQLCASIPYAMPANIQAQLSSGRLHCAASAQWGSFGIGRLQMPMVAQSVMLGGHVSRRAGGQSLPVQGCLWIERPACREGAHHHRGDGRENRLARPCARNARPRRTMEVVPPAPGPPARYRHSSTSPVFQGSPSAQAVPDLPADAHAGAYIGDRGSPSVRQHDYEGFQIRGAEHHANMVADIDRLADASPQARSASSGPRRGGLPAPPSTFDSSVRAPTSVRCRGAKAPHGLAAGKGHHSTSPPPSKRSTVPKIRLFSPMKPATKPVRRTARRARSASTAAGRAPALNTAMRSDMVSASVWSCVT